MCVKQAVHQQVADGELHRDASDSTRPYNLQAAATWRAGSNYLLSPSTNIQHLSYITP
jgi:hypothetical protein